MPAPLLTTTTPWAETYDEIIDVRSPGEYTEDHWPGSLNLPVLNDAERAEIGTLYKQVDPFVARKRGAALVARNIAQHLDTHFAPKDRTYQPLIHCWRGGQRSNSMALVLAQVGWRVTILEGGYKTYRAWVREQLSHVPHQLTFIVLSGATGSGKTELLHRLQAQGSQVLDLEQLANHRGSLLGQEWQQPQPSQKYFESLLLQRLQHFDPRRPIWVESESTRIGEVHLPPALWQQMKGSQSVEVERPVAERVNWIIQTYPHLIEHPDLLKAKLDPLKQRYGKAVLNTWFTAIDAHHWPQLVQALLEHHYDPTYRHGIERDYLAPVQTVRIPSFATADLSSALATLQTLEGSLAPAPES